MARTTIPPIPTTCHSVICRYASALTSLDRRALADCPTDVSELLPRAAAAAKALHCNPVRLPRIVQQGSPLDASKMVSEPPREFTGLLTAHFASERGRTSCASEGSRVAVLLVGGVRTLLDPPQLADLRKLISQAKRTYRQVVLFAYLNLGAEAYLRSFQRSTVEEALAKLGVPYRLEAHNMSHPLLHPSHRGAHDWGDWLMRDMAQQHMQYAKLAAATAMLRQHEEAHGRRFGTVIKLRPDLCISHPSPFFELALRHVRCASSLALLIHDAAAVYPRWMADAFANVWRLGASGFDPFAWTSAEARGIHLLSPLPDAWDGEEAQGRRRGGVLPHNRSLYACLGGPGSGSAVREAWGLSAPSSGYGELGRSVFSRCGIAPLLPRGTTISAHGFQRFLLLVAGIFSVDLAHMGSNTDTLRRHSAIYGDPKVDKGILAQLRALGVQDPARISHNRLPPLCMRFDR